MKKIKEGYQPKQSLDKDNPPNSESELENKLPWYITTDAGFYTAWDEAGMYILGSYNIVEEAKQRVAEYAKTL